MRYTGHTDDIADADACAVLCRADRLMYENKRRLKAAAAKAAAASESSGQQKRPPLGGLFRL